jgi:hypothetical protein
MATINKHSLRSLPKRLCCHARPICISPRKTVKRKHAGIPNAELKVIPSIWGYFAGIGINAADKEFIAELSKNA